MMGRAKPELEKTSENRPPRLTVIYAIDAAEAEKSSYILLHAERERGALCICLSECLKKGGMLPPNEPFKFGVGGGKRPIRLTKGGRRRRRHIKQQQQYVVR